MLDATTVAIGIVLGAVIGRWWALPLAIPLGLTAESQYSFEGFSKMEVGVLFAIATGIGLAIGVALRKMLRGSRVRR